MELSCDEYPDDDFKDAVNLIAVTRRLNGKFAVDRRTVIVVLRQHVASWGPTKTIGGIEPHVLMDLINKRKELRMQPTTLASKALLVKLTVRRANLTKRDATAELMIQSQMDDTSLVVNRKLFRDKLNPINRIMQKASEVYTYHKANTLAYIDKGPRLLPNNQYMEYTTAMRERIQAVDTMLAEYMPRYDDFVQLDMKARALGGVGAAKVEDYPTADEFQSKMGFDLRFTPLPDAKHFLFDISDDDMAEFNASMQQVAQTARAEVIKGMLEPLQHLVEKLNKPIGTEGAIFRDTAVENVVEGLKRAKALNVNADADVDAMADTLLDAIKMYDTNKDVLRESPMVREQAAIKLDEIAKKMAAYGMA